MTTGRGRHRVGNAAALRCPVTAWTPATGRTGQGPAPAGAIPDGGHGSTPYARSSVSHGYADSGPAILAQRFPAGEVAGMSDWPVVTVNALLAAAFRAGSAVAHVTSAT